MNDKTTGSKIRVITLLYPRFELLDVFGPLEMFSLSSHLNGEIELRLVSEDGKPVASSADPKSVCDHSFEDFEPCDILMIPGGLGSRNEIHNSRLIEWIKEQSTKAKYVISICTGAALLAKAGVLHEQAATTNKNAFDWVTQSCDTTIWVQEARWVRSQNIYTSSGVSSGIDMSLSLLEHLYGREHSLKVANLAEYKWNDDPNVDEFAAISPNKLKTFSTI